MDQLVKRRLPEDDQRIDDWGIFTVFSLRGGPER